MWEYVTRNPELAGGVVDVPEMAGEVFQCDFCGTICCASIKNVCGTCGTCMDCCDCGVYDEDEDDEDEDGYEDG